MLNFMQIPEPLPIEEDIPLQHYSANNPAAALSLNLGENGSYLDMLPFDEIRSAEPEWLAVAFLEPFEMRKLAQQLNMHADWLESQERVKSVYIG